MQVGAKNELHAMLCVDVLLTCLDTDKCDTLEKSPLPLLRLAGGLNLF